MKTILENNVIWGYDVLLPRYVKRSMNIYSSDLKIIHNPKPITYHNPKLHLNSNPNSGLKLNPNGEVDYPYGSL